MRSARANKAKLLGLSQTLLRLDKSKLSARDKLYILAVDELTSVANLILHKMKTIFIEVLDAAGNGRTDLEQIELHQFSSIVRCIERSNTREPGYDIIMYLFQIYDDCSTLIGRYRRGGGVSGGIGQDSRIGKLLSEKGIHKIENAFNEYLQKALERLNETIQMYLRTLPENEFQKETRIANWLRKSLNEIHPEKKVGVLMEFFATYDS